MKPGTRYAIEREVNEAEIEALQDQIEAEELARAIEADRQLLRERIAEEEADYWRSVEREFWGDQWEDHDMIDDGRLDYLEESP
jgi:hypothetical protein